MIGAGNVSDKFLPHLTKAQKGYTALPQAQWGQLVNPTTIAGLATLAVKAKELFGFNEPKIIRTPASAPKRLSIRDPRKIMMTTGKPLRPNSDLVSGEYDSEQLGNLLTEAKRRNMSYNDMMNLAAMGFQETKWGRSDDNIGHTKGDFGPEQDSYSSFINAYNTKMKDADRLKIKDEATRLQVYNGLGKIFPSTEADYHGFKMKKIYGVEVPRGGIDLRKNPLYGKQVIDIRDNVLKRNPEFMRYMDSTYRAPMPEEEFANGGPILDPRGQWAHPGKVTRIPGSDITMQGVPYPVYGVGSNGQEQMMYPDQEYDFGGASYVDEYPMMQNGGGLLSKTVSCSNCGHSWKSVEGGIDPLNCHKCGGLVKMQIGGALLQPITAQDMSNVLSLFSVPQKAITKLVTGKYQTPSEAMDIKNPYGAFATDAVLDPVNLVGAGLLGKMAKASTKSGVLSKTYKINPLAKKKPDVILTRTQKPGQTDELRRLDEFEKKGIDNLNSMERFEYKQMLNSEVSRPGYGRGFSSDVGDIGYYSDPSIQQTRGYEGFPEILKTRLNAKEAEKLNVGKNPLQGYISYAPKREFLLPKDLVFSAESFTPTIAGVRGPGTMRDFIMKANAEQKAANIPHWLRGYPSKKLPGLKSGGQHGGLDRWFAEKWVDVKTGKDCGRQEGESRAGYPACRPSKRVNSQTPKTSSEMSSAEKAKFKASKTSSQRINYNHKRNK